MVVICINWPFGDEASDLYLQYIDELIQMAYTFSLLKAIFTKDTAMAGLRLLKPGNLIAIGILR